jgi:hypothetical protein
MTENPSSQVMHRAQASPVFSLPFMRLAPFSLSPSPVRHIANDGLHELRGAECLRGKLLEHLRRNVDVQFAKTEVCYLPDSHARRGALTRGIILPAPGLRVR